MPKFITQEQADAWAEEHGPRINAGDAADILHENKFPDGGAYHKFLYKLGLWPRPEQTDQMRFGNETEPLVMKWYEDYKNMAGVSQAWAISDEADWIMGKSDFWNPDARHLAEFKSPTRDDSSDHLYAVENQRVPKHYWLQCIHLIECFGANTCDFVSWRSPDDYVVIPVERDYLFWQQEMLPRYREFYSYLEAGEFPIPQGRKQIEDEEFGMWLRRYQQAQAMKAVAESQMKEARAYLERASTARVNECEAGRTRWEVWRSKSQVNMTFDTIEDAEWAEQHLRNDAELMGRVRFDKREHEYKLWKADYAPNLVFKVEAKREVK